MLFHPAHIARQLAHSRVGPLSSFQFHHDERAAGRIFTQQVDAAYCSRVVLLSDWLAVLFVEFERGSEVDLIPVIDQPLLEMDFNESVGG